MVLVNCTCASSENSSFFSGISSSVIPETCKWSSSETWQLSYVYSLWQSSIDLSRHSRRNQNSSSSKLIRSVVSYQDYDNPSWQYWHPSRSSSSNSRADSVQLTKSSPVIFQILRVSQTALLFISMTHINRCSLSTSVNSQKSSSSLLIPSTRFLVESEDRTNIQSISSITRQPRRQDLSCRRVAQHLQFRSLDFAIPHCQRC